MTSRYIALANSPAGRCLVNIVGFSSPLRLERWQAGRMRPMDGPLVIGRSGALVEAVLPLAGKLTDAVFATVGGQFELLRWTVKHSPRAKATLSDASGLTHFEQLVVLHNFFRPVLKGLDKCPKMVALGCTPESLKDLIITSVQRSLEGFTRSLGKEIRRGDNIRLLCVSKDVEDQLESALRFFLLPKSTYVPGQVIHLIVDSTQVHNWSKPLVSQCVLATGATRGIGTTITETLAHGGAEVVLLDVSPVREVFEGLVARLGGRAMALDICVADVGQQLVGTPLEGADIVVHNAGITRDKTLVKMNNGFWNSVINVNLNAPQVLTQTLLDGGKLYDNGQVVLLASISGITGNLGQNNYAVSRAGLIGLAQVWMSALGKRGIIINVVAPGSIKTRMTAATPLTIREAGRRINSMSQGGLSQDVTETVAWFARPSSGAVSGQALRVCGQSLLGA